MGSWRLVSSLFSWYICHDKNFVASTYTDTLEPSLDQQQKKSTTFSKQFWFFFKKKSLGVSKEDSGWNSVMTFAESELLKIFSGFNYYDLSE